MRSFIKTTAALLVSGLFAQAALAEPKEFRINAQDAATALTEFARQANRQILFKSDRMKGLKTNPVAGKYEPADAIALLLKDTGLRAWTREGNVLVVDLERTGTSSGPGISITEMKLVGVDYLRSPAVRVAQQTEAQKAPPALAEESGEVEVVSTKIDGLNKKSIFQVSEDAALPYNIIDREDIERSGATNLEELFRNVPEITNYGTPMQAAVSNSQTTFGVTPQTGSLNLRGFGGDQTVVLVNGRRLAGNAFFGGGPDVSRIALGSIERIEILPAAAAAIYGGGAVGGAVNIILRKDYDGSDLTTYVGTSTNGGGTEYRLSFLDGHSFKNGRVRITTTLDYNKREAVYARERDYLTGILDRFGPDTPYVVGGRSAFETVTLRAFSAMPGTIVVNSPTLSLGIPGNPAARYAAVPAGLTREQANALTPASFSATAGQYRLSPRHGRSLLYRPVENYSAQVQLEYDILAEGRLSMFAEANVNYQKQDYSFPQDARINLSAIHPFNPFRDENMGGAGMGVPVTFYLDPTDLPEPFNLQEREDARFTLGFKGKITDRWDWTADVSGQYEKVYVDSQNPGTYMPTVVSGLTNALGVPATPEQVAERWNTYNPLADHSVYPDSPATVPGYDGLYSFGQPRTSWGKNAEASARLVGHAVDLPAGPLQVSPGGDIRVGDQEAINGFYVGEATADLLGLTPVLAGLPEVRPGFRGSESKQTVTEKGAFIEFNIPVFSRKWNPVPLELFEIGLSRRWDSSNRSTKTAVSDTISGRLGIVRDVMFRASLTEGFVPDRLATIARQVQTQRSTTVTDPEREGISTQVIVPTYITGGNPDLDRESGRSRNYGVMLRPRFVPGLLIDVNYFNTQRFNTASAISLSNLLNFPGDFPGRLERAPLTQDDIDNDFTAGAITKIDLSLINLARVETEGVDYRITYSIPVAPVLGTIDCTASATHYRSSITQARRSTAPIDRVNALNEPLSWRGSSQIFWHRNRLTAGVTGNYINSYFSGTTAPSPAFPNATGIDGRKIGRQLTFDLQFGYEIPVNSTGASDFSGWMDGTDLRIGILNVLDTEPPRNSDETGFYSRYGDPRQRYVYVQLKKSF